MGEEKSRDITGITVRYSDGSTKEIQSGCCVDLERAVRFYEAFQGFVYRSRNKYCQEKRDRGLVGYMVDMKITVPLGMDLNEVMEKLSEEWEQTFREKGEE